MTPEQFYKIYSNLPLEKRVLSVEELDGRSLHTMYSIIQEIEDKIRPDIVRRDEWLNRITKVFIKQKLI